MGTLVQKAHSRAVPWRASLSVVSPSGATDPVLCVYTVRLWSDRFGEDWPWADDLGFFASVPDCAYEANSTDNPTTIAAAAVEGGALLSLNLPATDLARLIPGSYHGQIVATAPADETDMLELAHFKTVFR
jgi:hypothetical protein